MIFRSRPSKRTGLRLAAGFAIVGTLSATTLATSEPGNRAAPVQNLMAMMQDRSPGEREQGVLRKSKPAAAAIPVARAKSASRDAALPRAGTVGRGFVPPVGDTQTLFAEATGTPVFAQLFAPTGPPAIGGPGVFVVPPASSGGGGGGGVIVAPPGGGGGGGSGPGGGIGTTPGDGGGTTPTPTPSVVPAVPEPETWLNMLIGFGALGLVLRKARRLKQGASGVLLLRSGHRG